MGIQPFTAAWDEAETNRVKRRVAETRLPWSFPGAGWSLGCDIDFLARMQKHWAQAYDPVAALAFINRYPQFIARVGDMDLHFVHVRGEGSGYRPLLISHGWPGSYLEFWDVVEPLAFPSRHGGTPEAAFDLVIPSLPGYAFSAKPARLIGPRATAALFHQLMTEILGYATYYAQGGDWGCAITTWLGNDHPEALRAVHLNMLALLQRTPAANAEEAAWLERETKTRRHLGDYMRLQSRRPQSLALAAADNPLGQAAWIMERYHSWTDMNGRELDEVFGMDRLITTVMLYVMTGSFASAAHFYHATDREMAVRRGTYPICRVPTAYADFPGDAIAPSPPRSRAEQIYDIRRWTEMPRGGHFPAWQEPELFLHDVRDFLLKH